MQIHQREGLFAYAEHSLLAGLYLICIGQRELADSCTTVAAYLEIAHQSAAGGSRHRRREICGVFLVEKVYVSKRY
jgi:hypothetical protein